MRFFYFFILLIALGCTEQQLDEENLFKLAQLSANNGKSDSLIYYTSDLLKADSNNAKVNTLLANYYFKNKQIGKALDHLQRANKRDSNNTDHLLKIAEINMLLGKNQNAFDYINKALKINQELGQGYFMKGVLYKHLKDSTKAISSFKTALEVDPQILKAYEELGLLLTLTEDSTAIFYYQNGIDAFPDDVQLKFGLYWSLQYFGKLEQAKNGYRSLYSKHANQSDICYNLSSLYARLNELDSARYFINLAYQLDSLDPATKNLKQELAKEK